MNKSQEFKNSPDKLYEAELESVITGQCSIQKIDM